MSLQPKYLLTIYDDRTGDVRDVITEFDVLEIVEDKNLGPISTKVKIYKPTKDLIQSGIFETKYARCQIQSTINSDNRSMFTGFFSRKDMKSINDKEVVVRAFGWTQRLDKILHRSGIVGYKGTGGFDEELSNPEDFVFNPRGKVSENIKQVVVSARGIHARESLYISPVTGFRSYQPKKIGALEYRSGSFTPSSSGVVNMIKMYLKTTGTYLVTASDPNIKPASLVAQIRTDDGTGKPSSTIIAETQSYYKYGEGDYAFVIGSAKFFFQDFAVTSGQKYHMVLAVPDSNGSQYGYFAGSATGESACSSTDGGVTWTLDSSNGTFDAIDAYYTDDGFFPLKIDEDNFIEIDDYQEIDYGETHTSLEGLKAAVGGLNDDYALRITGEAKVQLQKTGFETYIIESMTVASQWTATNCTLTEASGDYFESKYGGVSLEVGFLSGGGGTADISHSLASNIDLSDFKNVGLAWMLPGNKITASIRLYLYTGAAYSYWDFPATLFEKLKTGYSIEQDNWNDTLALFDIKRPPTGTSGGGVDIASVSDIKIEFVGTTGLWYTNVGTMRLNVFSAGRERNWKSICWKAL